MSKDSIREEIAQMKAARAKLGSSNRRTARLSSEKTQAERRSAAPAKHKPISAKADLKTKQKTINKVKVKR